jgi:hypothetical protein
LGQYGRDNKVAAFGSVKIAPLGIELAIVFTYDSNRNQFAIEKIGESRVQKKLHGVLTVVDKNSGASCITASPKGAEVARATE